MNLSAILVVVPADEIDAASAGLEALPGVEVRHTDPTTGRLLVIQEAADVDTEVEGLRRIQALPGIILAEMVYHHFEDDPGINAGLVQEGSEAAASDRVPAFLRD